MPHESSKELRRRRTDLIFPTKFSKYNLRKVTENFRFNDFTHGSGVTSDFGFLEKTIGLFFHSNHNQFVKKRDLIVFSLNCERQELVFRLSGTV